MKTNVILLIALLLGVSMNAQVQTLVSDGVSSGSYGGLDLEYTHSSDKLVHWTLSTMLGGGSVKLKERKPDVTLESDKLFLIEPELNVDLNINSWFRIGMGISYRCFMNLEMENISYKDINGPAAQVVFKFGSF